MKKTRVLIVSPSYPYPEYKDGTKKIIANLLTHNNYYDADILFLDFGFEEHSEKKRAGCNFFRLVIKPQTKLITVLKWMFYNFPFNVVKYSGVFTDLASLITTIEVDYDVIHICTPFLAPTIDSFSIELINKTILFPIDSLTLYTNRRLKLESSWFRKMMFYYELKKCEAFEKRYYVKTKKSVFVSPVDANIVKKLSNNINAIHIANGVDVGFFKCTGKYKLVPNSMVFTGNMSYAPNHDAAIFLVKEILPLISNKIDGIQIYFVGLNPKIELLKLQSENIVVTGFVEDIREYLEKAMIYISPLRFGSGIKNKVLEAMAMNKIVIGSQISFEGINVKNQVDCIKVDTLDAAAFSKVIIGAFNNYEKKSAIGSNARKLIIENYSWDSIRCEYGKLYASKFNN